jgi:AraC-like DNA-binding protein
MSAMERVQLTLSKHLASYVSFLTRIGEPIPPLLRSAGLPTTCLDDPRTPVPTAALWRFREVAATRTGLPNLTLNVMGPSAFTDLGQIARPVLCAPTLLKMIQVWQQLVYTESSTAIFDIRPSCNGDFIFSNRFALRHQQGEWHAELYVLLWMLKMVRLVEPAWSPTEICCTSKATPDRVKAIESLATRARFGECCTAFAVPSSMLALPPKNDESNLHHLKPREEFLWSTAPSDSFSAAIKQVIRAYTGDSWLTVHQASEAVGISVRTMQRRLSAENKSYSDVLEETRAEAARDLLENTDATILEISVQLGYSHQSGLTRAFRRWAAVSPTDFRALRRSL